MFLGHCTHSRRKGSCLSADGHRKAHPAFADERMAGHEIWPAERQSEENNRVKEACTKVLACELRSKLSDNMTNFGFGAFCSNLRS
jgi:hypothetical protein